MRNRILFFLLVASGILFLPKFSLADGVIIQTPAQGHTVSITHTVASFDIGTAATNVTIANTGMWISFNPGISQANFCGRSDFGILDINLHDNTTGQDAYSGQLAFDQGVYGTTGLSHSHDVTAGDDIRIDLNCDPSSATTTITSGITDIPSVYWWNGNGMTQPQYDAMIAYMTSQLTASSLHQYKSDASTTIAEGGLTTENSLVIKGIPTVASGTDQLRLELEVQPFATAFTGAATATSAATSSGNVVSLTIPSLPNNHYHWRSRVFDTTTNATSSWEEFGTSGNADFTIHAGGDTADLYYPVGYQWISKNAQYCYDHFSTSSPVCSGVTSATSSDNVYWGQLVSDNTAISFSGYVSMLLYDASSTSQCASGWWGHTQDIVDASGTLTDVFDGSVAAVGGIICHNGGGAQTISGPITSGNYVVVWQNPAHKCADESLSQCLTDHGGDADFSLTTLTFDGPVVSLSSTDQYKSDAITSINEGSSTTESAVVFGAQLNSTATSTLQLQVEVRSSGTSFTGVANVTSTFVAVGNNATATYKLFPEESSNGNYHWQARVVDSNNNSSTWQTFGSGATSTVDFVIKTVPLYTQEASIYPNAIDSAIWASSTYDNAVPGSQCGTGPNSSTIEACGCAITSVAMWLRYFGIATDTLGHAVNPENLNLWLASSSGYDNVNGGVLVWDKITDYASSSSGGAIIFDQNSFIDGSTTDELRPYIDPLLSSSTPDPVILFENNVPDGGSATTTHWVVATGFANHAGTSTYTIRDSFWYRTDYLNQETSTATALTVKGYRNNINGVRIFYDPPQAPIWGEYHINAPNALMLVDSQGRRTGKDPITGTIYREIPNTAYGEDESTPGHPTGDLFTSDLPNGKYSLYVLGGKTGAYGLYAANNQSSHTYRGIVQRGSMFAYAQTYDIANLPGSGLSLEGPALSSVSITSASPHNLPLTPPPPMPTPLINGSPHSSRLPFHPAMPTSSDTSTTPFPPFVPEIATSSVRSSTSIGQ